MESMSNVPYYLPRHGFGLGGGQFQDGIVHDGLQDAYDGSHMGLCAEGAAERHDIGREEQDAFCMQSYNRASEASRAGAFRQEIVAVPVKSKKGTVLVEDDEEPFKLQMSKVPTLRPVFKPSIGTITAANASSLNDGAASILVASEAFCTEGGHTPVARIIGYADTAREPAEFTDAPADAIPKAIAHAGLTAADIDLYEINEAFSVVSLTINKLLDLDPDMVNVNGGAVGLGHPIGASGARIIVTLIHALQQRGKKYGVAAICNGGGGASAIVIERLW
jgi:acetyl-CoA C-acetyltransferase